MEIVVQADLFDTGFLVDPEHLRLGSEPASGSGSCRAGQYGDDWTVTIWANLQDCGTRLSSTHDKIIYSNVLVYSPEPSSEGLFRLDGATIPVECHFDKRYSVASMSLGPAWVPSVLVASAENRIDFKLRLMTDDWLFERGSHAYFVGDPMHFEVSAVIRKHKPLRVFVDRCVATAGPDPDAALRYDFIERNGCLYDAFLTNSSSHFLSRVEGHKLQFLLEAFRFYQQHNTQVYITCWLRAVPDSLGVTSQSRACSFINNRWWSADGEHETCRTCDPLVPAKEKTATTKKLTTNLEPSFAQNKPKQPVSFLWVRPGQVEMHKSQWPSSGLKKTHYTTEGLVQFGPLTVE
ncbi:zona pellucida sperm-binding protein 3-like isoform X2 [Syngnathoides biaculeatus]|nr:zona pellucida sperm-binding protein 3-like isoform X2 [Syngnathoides biaculeatus]